MKYKILLTFLFIVTIHHAQTDVAKQINALMSQIRSGTSITADRNKITSSVNYKETSQLLKVFFADSVASIRYEALGLNSQVALRSKDKTLIKNSIQSIINNCVLKGSINNQIAGLLKNYSNTDFSEEELMLIKNVLTSQESNIGTLVRIYAFAGQQKVLNDINALLANQKLSKSDKKDIKLALVRSGDEGLNAKMLETLKQQVINDDLIYNALPDIIYTKNKQQYQYILNAILKDDKRCSSANNDDSTPITCAYRLIEQIAPNVLNFPVTINEKGEINSKDLGKTLQEVRTWINANINTFVININTY